METYGKLQWCSEVHSKVGTGLHLLHQKNPVCFETGILQIEDFIPSIEMSYLNKKLGHFEKDRKRNKGETIPYLVSQAVKHYLTSAINPRRRHQSVPDSFYLYSGNYEDIKRYTKPRFGFSPSDLFGYLEDEEILVSLPVQSKKTHSTRAFKLTNQSWTGLKNFLETYQLDPRKLIQPKTDEEGVESEDQRDNNIHLPRWLDLKTINPHYSKIRKIDEREFHSLGDFDTGDWCLFKMIVGSLETFDGYLRQDYVQSPFGRYFGRRVNENLQLIPNRLLPFLIPNTFDYDLRAACFSLIGQVSQRHRPEQRTTTIQDYVKNKTEIRRQLSKEIGVDEEIIKKGFTIIGHGGRQSKHSWMVNGKKVSGALVKTFGNEEITKTFLENTFVKKLCGEIKECGRTIVSSENYPKCFKGSHSQKLAFTYQQTEVKVLQKMVEYSQLKGNKVLSINHDGLITQNQMDTKEVEEYISSSIGFQVSLDEGGVGSFY